MGNLRWCIIETKWKYDVATEDKQVAWKHLILSFMERYFYLICFATYALEHGPGGYEKSFQAYMDEHKELRTMIEEGKDKLEWYRTVDASKLEHLKEIINSPNYKDNLGTLIRTIKKVFLMFSVLFFCINYASRFFSIVLTPTFCTDVGGKTSCLICELKCFLAFFFFFIRRERLL